MFYKLLLDQILSKETFEKQKCYVNKRKRYVENTAVTQKEVIQNKEKKRNGGSEQALRKTKRNR